MSALTSGLRLETGRFWVARVKEVFYKD
jgi:hypothetical protein